MTLYVFTGPTLSAEEGIRELDAVFLPPAAQGDVYRAALCRPSAIGIIDGYFERTPSVSHKEILWAMAQGVHVLGAASMGALRAAELATFGMEGVGDIYDAYARGEIEADDEVAVAHAPAEHGYRPASEALVNVRATLRAAEQAGALSPRSRGQIETIAKGLFYPDRCYPAILHIAEEQGTAIGELAALRAFLETGRVDQKRQDGLALLRTMRARFTGRVEPKKVRYHFQATDAWEHIRAKVDRTAFAPSVWAPLVEELKRVGDYAAVRRGALGRVLALEMAQRENRRPEGAVLREVVDALCREKQLGDALELERWLRQRGVGEVERFLLDEVQVRWAEILYGPDVDRYLVDHLCSIGDWTLMQKSASDEPHPREIAEKSMEAQR